VTTTAMSPAAGSASIACRTAAAADRVAVGAGVTVGVAAGAADG